MAFLAPDELKAILEKLGLEPVSNDIEGLRAFYRAWCLGVPFDDLQKTLALFENPGAPLPPLDAHEFFQNWLSAGTGGTCWQHSDAIYTLARALGFDARRAVATMFDLGDGGHGTTVVHLQDGSRWVLDNAFLSMEPLRIDEGEPSFFEGTFCAEVEHDGGETYVHGHHPPMHGIFFRFMEWDVPKAVYAEKWSKTHAGGPFVKTLHVRRNLPDRFFVLRGDQFHTCFGGEMSVETLDAEGIKHRLRTTFGIASEFVERWARSGALESSQLPPGDRPDLPRRIRPSLRVTQ